MFYVRHIFATDGHRLFFSLVRRQHSLCGNVRWLSAVYASESSPLFGGNGGGKASAEIEPQISAVHTLHSARWRCCHQTGEQAVLQLSSQQKIVNKNITSNLGHIPCLVVMGGDSHSRGYGFESQQHLLNGRSSPFLMVKMVFV